MQERLGFAMPIHAMAVKWDFNWIYWDKIHLTKELGLTFDECHKTWSNYYCTWKKVND